MKGHGQQLTRKQEALIAALLTEPTHAAAAAKAAVSEATLHRWLRLPEFQTAYRQARRAVVEAAIGRLQQTTGKAVDALERNLTCEHPGSEIRAALGILDQAVKAVELLDVVDRVEELERLMKEVRDDDPQEPHRQAAGRGPRDGRQKAPDRPPTAVPERDVGEAASDGGGSPAAGIPAGDGSHPGPDRGIPPEVPA
jgi:hypothetical protein